MPVSRCVSPPSRLFEGDHHPLPPLPFQSFSWQQCQTSESLLDELFGPHKHRGSYAQHNGAHLFQKMRPHLSIELEEEIR